MNYCYANTLGNFIKTTKESWLREITCSFREMCNENASESQIKSWDDCFDVLQEQLIDLANANPNIYIIFEYVLRYTSGKRPDVILLSQEGIVILEFKRKEMVLLSDRIQVEEYARKLYNYHSGCHSMSFITPVLVLSSSRDFEMYKEGIANIIPSNRISEITEKLKSATPLVNAMEWINARYSETPSVLEYSRAKKEGMVLPEYEVVRKAGIADAEACIKDQVKNARENTKFIIAFVNGVPGSGKTLLGVDLAYDSYNEDLGIHSSFMSGNGPLVAVLQDALDDGFIKNIHIYLDQYTEDGAPEFNSNVCVFDEGQRTWTASQRQAKRKAMPEKSEAELFIEMVSVRVNWCFLLVLIGDGQEINSGEENSIQQWKDAIIQDNHNWEILCPPNLEAMFSGYTIIQDERRGKLELKNTLRSNSANSFSIAVNNLVDGNVENARVYFNRSKKLYPMFVTRDINNAKSFCRTYYEGINDKKYGLIASSQAIILNNYGVDNSYESTKQTRAFPAKWYNEPSTSSLSCCALDKPVTEFGCQGLELDMPIVCWEKDFIWDGSNWLVYASGRNGRYSPAGQKRQYRINAYRVLLTRGRDGLIVFVPGDRELDKTYALLKSLGFEDIKQ